MLHVTYCKQTQENKKGFHENFHIYLNYKLHPYKLWYLAAYCKFVDLVYPNKHFNHPIGEHNILTNITMTKYLVLAICQMLLINMNKFWIYFKMFSESPDFFFLVKKIPFNLIYLIQCRKQISLRSHLNAHPTYRVILS